MNNIFRNDKQLELPYQTVNKENFPIPYKHYFTPNVKSENLIPSKGIAIQRKEDGNLNKFSHPLNYQGDYKDEKFIKSAVKSNALKPNENLLRKTATQMFVPHSEKEVGNKLQNGLNDTSEIQYRLYELKQNENTKKLSSDASKLSNFKSSVKHKTENHHFVANSLITPKEKSSIVSTMSDAKLKKRNTYEMATSVHLTPNYIQAQKSCKPHEHMITGSTTKQPNLTNNELQKQNSAKQLRTYNSLPRLEDNNKTSESNKTSENVLSLVERLKQGASFLNDFPMLIEPGLGNLDDDDDDSEEENRDYYKNFSEETEVEEEIEEVDKNLQIFEVENDVDKVAKDKMNDQIKPSTVINTKIQSKTLNDFLSYASENKSKNENLSAPKTPLSIQRNDQVCSNVTVKDKNEVKKDPESYVKMCQMISEQPEKNKFKTLKVNDKSYFKLNLLGKGGSSKVYQVYDFETGKILAIKKVNLAGTDHSIREGFKNEIKLLQQLQGCDRVVKLYDYEYCRANSEIYVVMEKGDTDLGTALKNAAASEPLTPVQIKFYWSEMLKAVKEIHDSGIIHSDLKPANFLLVSGKLKLIDFGISSSVQKDTTSVIKDNQIGTINFMPPEAIQSIYLPSEHRNMTEKKFKINRKADVWSLGCILYNLVYGQTPFQSFHSIISKFQAIINPHYEIKYPPLDDDALLNVIKSCLIRDPYKRPSIEELLQHPYLHSNHEELSDTSSSLRVHSVIHQILQQLTPKCRNRVQEVAEKLNVFPKTKKT
ncbi:dual specificity protein kinase Ttk [Centruroides vittatus]|uniref:dual specificity protein kinase Ttk n=1 Tax=Centruroides vittatus TaxID=120091 RepID=UPI00351023E3